MAKGSGNSPTTGYLNGITYGVDALGVYHSHDYTTRVDFAKARAWSQFSVRTPGFRNRTRNRRKKRFGLDLPMNPYSFSLYDNSGLVGAVSTFTQFLPKGLGYEYVLEYGDHGSNLSDPSGGSNDAIDAKTRNKLFGKLHDQKVNLGNAIGEGRQLINLFSDNIQKIAGAGRELKRGNLQGAAVYLGGVQTKLVSDKTFRKQLRKDYPKALANGWLELKYGWEPLLSDIHGALEFHADRQIKTPRTKEVSSTSRQQTNQFTVVGTEQGFTDYSSSKGTVRYGVYYSRSGNHDLTSLGLINPLSIAWELTPWSFVVDWALPIGTYLNNMTATFGLTFVKGWKTSWSQGIHRREYFGISTSSPDRISLRHDGRVQQITTVNLQRTPLSGFPDNPPPTLKNPFSQFKSLIDPGDHALNALALLTQTFGRSGSSHGPGKWDVSR